MNAPRVAAALRKFLEAGAELADAIESEEAPTPRVRKAARKYVIPDGPEPSEMDRQRAKRALRRAGLVGSGR